MFVFTTQNFVRYLLLGMTVFSLTTGTQAAGNQVPVCHKEKTIWIAPSAVSAHVAHGDKKVRCQDRRKSRATVIFRCGVSSDGELVVTATSSYPSWPAVVPMIDDDCAEANAILGDFWYRLTNSSSTPVGDNFETEYFYEKKYIRPEDR
jgi:hypothetical protein